MGLWNRVLTSCCPWVNSPSPTSNVPSLKRDTVDKVHKTCWLEYDGLRQLFDSGHLVTFKIGRNAINDPQRC